MKTNFKMAAFIWRKSQHSSSLKEYKNTSDLLDTMEIHPFYCVTTAAVNIPKLSQGIYLYNNRNY